jgi:hypothetical protein
MLCHNPILGYSPKFNFFQNKNKINKIKAGNVEKAGKGIKLQFFRGNSRPNCTLLCPRMGKRCKFKVKLNDYWMNLHKN